MIASYKISIGRQLTELTPALTKYGIVLAIYIYLFGFVFEPYFILGVSLFSLIDLLPLLILHFQYFMENRHVTFSVNREERFITYKNNEIDIVADFAEISFLRCIDSYGNAITSPGWYSFGAYRY